MYGKYPLVTYRYYVKLYTLKVDRYSSLLYLHLYMIVLACPKIVGSV